MQKIKEMLDDIEKTKNSEEIIDIMEKVIMCHAMELKEENEKKYMDLVEKFYLKIYGEHFNEKIAMKAVKEMVYIIPDYRFDYTPEQIESFIHQAYQQTSQIMAKYGKTANPIGDKVNKWDKYFVYNMICADYPLSHGGDNQKISMMSYEFLSNPDGCEEKAYKYYKAMSKKE